jgi:MoaA/NifB/PqqE/SkfB family radical SAM enzyme
MHCAKRHTTIMINDNNKHSWCVNAFHGMSANNDGSTKMCCMIKKSYNSTGGITFFPRDKNFFIGTLPIQDNFNNSQAQQIRNNLENGIRDDACSNCWEEEDANRKSKRQRDNERYEHEVKWEHRKPYVGLAKFELNLGNNCNIKCRTCAPGISSTWMKEAYDLDHSEQISYKEYSNSMKKYHQQYDDDSPFWDDLAQNLENIKQFDFYGGEPFLSKKMWEILKICVDKGYAKDIELHYNTNGTKWPKETELWKHFKYINLSFSIDGIGERFEYMRFPAKWDEVKSNMQKARDYKLTNNNMSISWCITLSTINIYYLEEIIEEHDKSYQDFGIYLNLVHGPIHFNIGKLSPSVRQSVIDKLEAIPKEYKNAWYQLPGIIGFIKNGKYEESTWKTFLATIKKHDVYREQDFTKTFKEYNDIILE